MPPITATDDFSGQYGGGGVAAMPWPVDDQLEITPSDTDELVKVGRAIYVTVAGTLRITTAKGTVINYTSALIPGMWHAMRIRKVHSTGTSATGIKIGY